MVQLLDGNGEINSRKMLECNYYNPITHGWSEKDRQKEVYERETADYVVYGITKGIRGVYSIADW